MCVGSIGYGTGHMKMCSDAFHRIFRCSVELISLSVLLNPTFTMRHGDAVVIFQVQCLIANDYFFKAITLFHNFPLCTRCDSSCKPTVDKKQYQITKTFIDQ